MTGTKTSHVSDQLFREKGGATPQQFWRGDNCERKVRLEPKNESAEAEAEEKANEDVLLLPRGERRYHNLSSGTGAASLQSKSLRREYPPVSLTQEYK
jgi:hypothetical protein